MSLVSSLPDRLLAEHELRDISDAANGIALPVASVDVEGHDDEVYPAFVYATNAHVLTIGYRPEASSWRIINVEGPDSDPDDTFKKAHEWVVRVWRDSDE